MAALAEARNDWQARSSSQSREVLMAEATAAGKMFLVKVGYIEVYNEEDQRGGLDGKFRSMNGRIVVVHRLCAAVWPYTIRKNI